MRTRSRWPASSGTSWRWLVVSPVIDEQPLPAESQRCHWYLEVIGDVPLHVPGLAVRVLPTDAVPVIVGGEVLDGATCVCARAAPPPSAAASASVATSAPASTARSGREALEPWRRRCLIGGSSCRVEIVYPESFYSGSDGPAAAPYRLFATSPGRVQAGGRGGAAQLRLSNWVTGRSEPGRAGSRRSRPAAC